MKQRWERLKVDCEKAKRVLSYATQASIDVELLHESINFSMNFTRARFEELNMDYFTDLVYQETGDMFN